MYNNVGPPGDVDWRWPNAPQLAQQPHQPRVVLTPFWTNKVTPWFNLAESTFRRYGVNESQHMYDLVLPALSGDILDQLGSVLDGAPAVEDPYNLLKDRLKELFVKDVFDQAYSILHAAELGDRRPSVMMESLLASLPPGEVDGILFKAVFLTRLPDDIRNHVAVLARDMASRPLAAHADQLWFARNTRRAASARAVMAVADPGVLVEASSGGLDDLTVAVAALGVANRQKKQRGGGRGRGRGGGRGAGRTAGDAGKAAPYVCWRHCEYGSRAYNCEDEQKCTWSGNAKAGE